MSGITTRFVHEWAEAVVFASVAGFVIIVLIMLLVCLVGFFTGSETPGK